MKYTITSKRQTLVFAKNADLEQHVKRLRDIKEDYTITYPDGWKAKHEYIKNN